ncbi:MULTISPECIES: BlaI/MecI/CopY family transcriptional regulator [unclassified Shewanella]|uniref:BlaI/MecI/CopY family transcriptional regulator n=1 Tax=unclassified Shewanella TaxID=196818 RepID=UPI000C856F46|nr:MULTISPECIES: BlaI/MecI/CopY family transcriptional regulator [unclassified Shewanella]MDO6620489.1 BlaI/MecI/CopY family transcriptional regulator [Shewanella sp. 6_MG-2023]MDO6641458.1 BlaI/MecI/CopY family transcriptional regulator [Shewanella sp. 5_MG-2023]MDO6679590.1 BlaI/MecI/CopY family transcriptional regulator [Shewanella sp. 4_MG-2023]MDO6776551.1 BlaI/MecI/CopY family transcriptional regulator [Shewanella sp. 3_MG-2023]PMG29027.1 transcriptional regulator [Shewanella sp. 10N.286
MKDISNSELLVLKQLWQRAPLTSTEVVDALALSHDMHEKTVKTLINRLVKKQAISFEKQGRVYHYSPLIVEHDYTAKESESFVERMFSGKLTPLVAGFAKNNKLSAEDVAELKSLLDDWQQEQK